MGILLSCGACSKENMVNVTPVRSLDLARYLGSWYEIARFDHSFERGMEFTQAAYTLEEDGTVRVENTGYKNGEFKSSLGKAKRPNPIKEPAVLRVSFFWPFFSDYRILMIDPEYRYALVSSKGPDYLWILSRYPTVPDDVLVEIVTEAEGRGFDTTKLIWVKQ